MYYGYILQSEKDNKYYVGCTNDLSRRVTEHNRGQSKATRNRTPLKLVLSEECDTLKQAIQREKLIKSYKGGNAFNKLISNAGIV